MWLGLLARVANEHSSRANQNPLLSPSSLKLSLKQGERLRDEGLLFLHGLESNPETSLQTPQEA